jgi:hypothetical protein
MLGSNTSHPASSAGRHFEIAHGELRSALIRATARRVGKLVEPVSLQEACSGLPLAELYRRKLHTNWLTGVVERLFRWWR